MRRQVTDQPQRRFPAASQSRAQLADDSTQPLRPLVNVDGRLLVDVRGAATLIGVSPGSLYRMISAKAFPEGRPYPGIPAKRKAWRVDDVVAWVAEHFPSQRTDQG